MFANNFFFSVFTIFSLQFFVCSSCGFPFQMQTDTQTLYPPFLFPSFSWFLVCVLFAWWCWKKANVQKKANQVYFVLFPESLSNHVLWLWLWNEKQRKKRPVFFLFFAPVNSLYIFSFCNHKRKLAYICSKRTHTCKFVDWPVFSSQQFSMFHLYFTHTRCAQMRVCLGRVCWRTIDCVVLFVVLFVVFPLPSHSFCCCFLFKRVPSSDLCSLSSLLCNSKNATADYSLYFPVVETNFCFFYCD